MKIVSNDSYTHKLATEWRLKVDRSFKAGLRVAATRLYRNHRGCVAVIGVEGRGLKPSSTVSRHSVTVLLYP